MRATRPVVVALLLFFAPSAPAQPISVDVTSTTTTGWHTKDAAFENANYGELFQRLNLAAGYEPWRFALRLDTATFLQPPSAAVSDVYRLEKATASYIARAFEVSGGDGYVSVGRGLALSLRKVDELGLDTTLRGLKLLVHDGNLEGTLVAGCVNINNVDEATGQRAEDPFDLLGGLEAKLRIHERLRIGAYATLVAFRDSLGFARASDYTDRTVQLGSTLDAPRLFDNIGLYVEGMLQSVSTDPDPEDPLAYALYATGTAYLGRASLLFEGKFYGPLTPLSPDLETPFASVSYHNPPTVERVLQPLENPQRDIAGGRLRLDWRFAPTFLAYANYGVFRDWLGYPDPAAVGEIRDAIIHDPYVGVELRWNDVRSWAIASGGYRAVFLDGDSGMVRGDGHAEIDVSQTLGGPFSVTLHVIHFERQKHASAILDERFRQGTIDAGIRARSSFTISGGYDYTTEPTQPKRDYFHGNVSWNITPSSSLRLFVGSARGGLRCISGVCRAFPAFEGAKVTATLRF